MNATDHRISPPLLLLAVPLLCGLCGVIACRSASESSSEMDGAAESTTRVTRDVSIAEPSFEEGYEEPAEDRDDHLAGDAPPANSKAASSKEDALAGLDRSFGTSETRSQKDDEQGTGQSKTPSFGKRPAPIAGSKKAALEALDERSSGRSATAESLEDAVRRKQGRAALDGDLLSTFPVEDEINLGTGVAARILAECPEKSNERLWEYVSFVGYSIVEVCPRPSLRYYFAVVASDEVNAYSAPGGFVFITEGALRFCRDEAELAAILAHEIAHIARQHALQSLDASKGQLRKYNVLAEMDQQEWASSPAHEKELVAELSAIADDLYLQTKNPHNRTLEKDADREALIYLDRAGYDPYAAISLMERVQAQSGSMRTAPLASHPAPADRLVELKAAFARSGLIEGRGVRNRDRFEERTKE